MNKVLPWLGWALAVAVVIGIGLAGAYLVILGTVWMFLKPFAGMLQVLAVGMCN